MKTRFTVALLAIIALFPTLNAYSAQTAIPDQQQPVLNILTNPGFENGKYGWTASGGATATANTTAKGIGNYGYDWDSNSAAQTLVSASVTIPAGLYGKNGLAYCNIKVPSGSATHTITVNDGTNDLVTAQTLTSYSTGHVIQPITFTMPSSGTIRLKLTSVASNEPEIYIDSCYIGENWKVGSGNFVSSWQSWTPTGSWSSNTTYAGKYRRVGDSAEFDITVQTSGAPTSATLTANLPSGIVIDTNKLTNTSAFVQSLQSNGTITDASAGGSAMAGVAYLNTTSVTLAYLDVTSASKIGLTTPLTPITQAVPMTWAASDAVEVYFKVPVVGWDAGDLYMPDTKGWRVDASIGGANVSLGTSAQSAYTGIEDTGLTLTNNQTNAPEVLTAQIPCSSTNSPSGTTCAAGSESVGVSFVLPAAQTVEACAEFAHQIVTAATGVVNTTFQIVETPTNAQTISQEGKGRVQSGFNTASSTITFPHKVCGTFAFTSAGQKVLRLFYEQAVTATVTSSTVFADNGSSNGQRDIHFTVRPINQQVPAPVLIGSVTNSTTVKSDGPTGLTTIEYGTYTPSLSNVANLSAATPYVSTYVRIGNIVTVDLIADIDPTAAAPTVTKMSISLPIASNLAALNDCAGVGASQSQASLVSQAGAVYADAASDKCYYDFPAQNGANLTHGLHFTYKVQ